jgi:hypothetical protein
VKHDQQKREHDLEMISDQDLWSVIRYLDPESDACLGDLAVIVISLTVFASIVGAVWLIVHLRGL